MGIHQGIKVGPYLIASNPIMKEVVSVTGKQCTKCAKKFLSIDNFCEIHGQTLVEAHSTRSYIDWSPKLENDERLFQISNWLPNRKDGTTIYAANISYDGEFDDSLLDYDNGGVISLMDLDSKKYIDAFKIQFEETIGEIANTFKTLKFEFGVIQYWS